VTIVLVMRGLAQGIPTLQLADELELDYETLLHRRHLIQQLALEHKPTTPLTDPVTESDEMFQNCGEKGKNRSAPPGHDDPADPPVAEPITGAGRALWTMTALLFWGW